MDFQENEIFKIAHENAGDGRSPWGIGANTSQQSLSAWTLLRDQADKNQSKTALARFRGAGTNP